MKRITERQRHLIRTLCVTEGRFAAWKEFARGYLIFDQHSFIVDGPFHHRTVEALERARLVIAEGNRVVPTIAAWDAYGADA